MYFKVEKKITEVKTPVYDRQDLEEKLTEYMNSIIALGLRKNTGINFSNLTRIGLMLSNIVRTGVKGLQSPEMLWLLKETGQVVETAEYHIEN